MSNKQARRAVKAPAAAQDPALATSSPNGILRVRVSTGLMILGGAAGAVSAFLPWTKLADGTTRSGLESITGIGALALGVTSIALAVFILLRPNSPNARMAAWAGLVAALALGAMGFITVLLTSQASGASVAAGVLVAFSGGMVVTLGVRGLLERR